MCCTRLAGNVGPKKSPKIRHLSAIAQLYRAVSSQLRHVGYRQSEKNLLNSNVSHMSFRYGELRPLAAEIVSLVWGIPANVNGFRVLAALLHGTLAVGVSQTLRR